MLYGIHNLPLGYKPDSACVFKVNLILIFTLQMYLTLEHNCNVNYRNTFHMEGHRKRRVTAGDLQCSVLWGLTIICPQFVK